MVIAMQEDWYSSLGYDHQCIKNEERGAQYIYIYMLYTAKPKKYPKRETGPWRWISCGDHSGQYI